jgi:hypothetical protein
MEGFVYDDDMPCECGHRFAEHSICGSCHGCRCCDDNDDVTLEADHSYDRCRCSCFVAPAGETPDVDAWARSISHWDTRSLDQSRN